MFRVKDQEQLTMDDHLTLVPRKDSYRDVNGDSESSLVSEVGYHTYLYRRPLSDPSTYNSN